MIRCIEEYSTNAWPALQTLLQDGWVLRFANGFTRRANSVYPLYPTTLPLDEKISACEALYHAQGLPTCFKMTPASQPAGLDDALLARGYLLEAPTSVQQLDLRALPVEALADVEVAPRPSAEWLLEFGSMSGSSEQHQAAHQQILASILYPCGYAALRCQGQLASCGLAVLQDGCLGLFDIVTAPAYRRQGYASQLVSALLRWGKRQGAHTAYLQVMQDNAPALNLYASLGFQEIYPYWYRVEPGPLPTLS